MSFEHQLVALACKFSPGAFSGERIFEVKLANGETYRSLAPRQFCWNAQDHLVAETEPQTEMDGMIAARVVDILEGQKLVEVPDGKIIAVDEKDVKPRPTSIQPPESRLHVSVRS